MGEAGFFMMIVIMPAIQVAIVISIILLIKDKSINEKNFIKYLADNDITYDK
jgi:hypothetical protein